MNNSTCKLLPKNSDGNKNIYQHKTRAILPFMKENDKEIFTHFC